MSFQEEIFDKIEAYLSGELDAGETTAFENQISADGQLKAEVEKHKVANALIMEQRLLSVKNILQEERIKDSNSGTSFKPFGFVLLAVAAIGIGTSVWLLNKEDVGAFSAKEEKTTNQIASGTVASENKNTTENTARITNGTSQSVAATADNGFHKQQIQQIEEHLRVDEKGTLYRDTTSSVTKRETTPSILPTTVNPVNKNNVPADVAPCAIHASVKASSSCSHEATGTILVNAIEGGTKPYSISFSSANNESVVNGALSKGIYNVVVSDAAGCVKTYPDIVVAEKECPIDYSFNPFIGEKWSIESYKAAGQLELYNKGGVLYHKENLDANGVTEWSGMGINNQIIPGYYIFVIKYADGTSRRGSVTIVQ